MEKSSSFSSVIQNRGFLNLWVNQILVQLSYNSLNFALIIWVFNLTNSNIAVSLLLVAVYLPAVLFGLFAGVFVDITDRKKIINIINFLLATSFFSLIFLKGSYPAILFIAFFVNTLAQFYTPAESSAIPIVVKRQQLLIANSLFSTTLYISFLLGFGLAGPLINHFGINFVFGLGGVLLTTAFFLSFTFPSIVSKADAQGAQLIQAIKNKHLKLMREIGLSEIRQTMSLIKSNLSVFSAIIILSIVQVITGVLAVVTPSFLERELQIKATEASTFMVIPLGVGMVVGGLMVGKVGYRFAKRTLVGWAVSAAGILFLLVGISPLVTPVINYFPRPIPLPFFYQPSLSATMATISFLAGITMVSIIIPSQTVLQENTPEQDRGKVFSVLAVVMAGLSLIPVLAVGLVADLVGVLPIFIAMGGSVALFGLMMLKPQFYFDQKHLPLRFQEFLGLGHWQKK